MGELHFWHVSGVGGLGIRICTVCARVGKAPLLPTPLSVGAEYTRSMFQIHKGLIPLASKCVVDGEAAEKVE